MNKNTNILLGDDEDEDDLNNDDLEKRIMTDVKKFSEKDMRQIRS
jgi:hypothetical protein